MTLIGAKFDADLINISEVTSRKTKWPRFFGLPCTSYVIANEKSYMAICCCADEKRKRKKRKRPQRQHRRRQMMLRLSPVRWLTTEMSPYRWSTYMTKLMSLLRWSTSARRLFLPSTFTGRRRRVPATGRHHPSYWHMLMTLLLRPNLPGIQLLAPRQVQASRQLRPQPRIQQNTYIVALQSRGTLNLGKHACTPFGLVLRTGTPVSVSNFQYPLPGYLLHTRVPGTAQNPFVFLEIVKSAKV